MKKVLTVLVVLAVLCTSVFASNMSVRGHFSPLVMAGDFEGGIDFYSGTYNFDAQFNYYVTDNIRVGAKADLLMAGGEPQIFALFAKAGYVYSFNDSWSVAADLGLGCELSTPEFPLFAGDFELTGAYNFNKNLSIDFGAQVSFEVQEGEPLVGLGPIVGFEYKF